MGCAASSPELDADAMLEKQRQIMLTRQKEFEMKRQQQQASNAAGGSSIPTSSPQLPGRPNPVVTGGKPLAVAKTGSAPPSPATPVKPVADAPKLSKLDDDFRQPSKSSNATTDDTDAKATQPSASSSSIRTEGATAGDTGLAADVEQRARKYTVDHGDVNARRSKNIHDLAMYGKDVTRRASFNPRPKESPFTPEMQAAMKAGHEAMMAAEAEKKMDRMAASGGEKPEILPTFEDEDEKEKVESPDSGEENKENGEATDEKSDEEPVAAPKPKEKEPEDFALDVDEARKKADAEAAKANVVPGADDPNVAKFLAKDNVDRRSKNIHDLGQYFNRRASFVPDAPGQRRPSFLPNSDQTRRASFLTPPTNPT